MTAKPTFGPDLKARIATGVPLAALGAFAVWLGGPFMAIFIALGCGLMGWEWRGITAQRDADRMAEQAVAIAAAALPPLTAYFFGFPVALAVAAVGAALVAFLEIGASGRPVWTALGVFVVALTGACFVWLRGDAAYGLYVAAWIPLVVACADMGGYFVGRAVGGPKLAPAISPNKTISGALGGLAMAVLVGIGFALATGIVGVGPMIVLSLVIAAISQAGDLTESAVKRRFAVKDASGLIPGHGGVMDRLDAMMAATLAVAAVTWLRGQAIFAW